MTWDSELGIAGFEHEVIPESKITGKDPNGGMPTDDTYVALKPHRNIDLVPKSENPQAQGIDILAPGSELKKDAIESSGKGAEKMSDEISRRLREDEGILTSNNGKNYQSPGKTKSGEWKNVANKYHSTSDISVTKTPLTKGLKFISKAIEKGAPLLDMYSLSRVIMGKEKTYTLLPLSFVVEGMKSEQDEVLLQTTISQGYQASLNYADSSTNDDIMMVFMNQEDYMALMSGQITSLSQMSSLAQMEHGYAVLVQNGKSLNVLAGFKFK